MYVVNIPPYRYSEEKQAVNKLRKRNLPLGKSMKCMRLGTDWVLTEKELKDER